VTFAANVRAPLVLAQLVAPGMRERRRGWVVNVSSASAEPPQGPPYAECDRKGGMHLYAASKSALNRLTGGLAAELHGDGIAVNTLAPVAAVMTPGVEALDATMDQRLPLSRVAAQAAPAGSRVARPAQERPHKARLP
jgi:citronellol/citronellal dehydrogenase